MTRSLMRRVLRVVAWTAGIVVVALGLLLGTVAWQIHDLFGSDGSAEAALRTRLDAARAALPGTNVDLALDGCDLYRTMRGTSAWTPIDLPYAPGSYPRFMTGCTRAHVDATSDGALVFTCAQAIGAGGGCARGGSFRSRDGVTWERADEHRRTTESTDARVH